MNKHRYILELYKGMNTRYRCPSCQQRDKTFSRYIDTETGQHLHPSVGKCNREINCGYHYTPKQYFQDNHILFDTPKLKPHKPQYILPKPKPISFIPVDVFKSSLKAHETNHFVQFLIKLFGVELAGELVSRYFIATSKHWNGATVFWQIDTQGKVRTGKIMLYSPDTGKRVKEPFNHITWAHKALKLTEFELNQCLFGEHLLIDKTKPVAIVESEKTAIIASVYLPLFIWLAVGSLTNLTAEKCSILKGRKVILFPDLNAFDKWTSKAKELSHMASFSVSDLLERRATEAERQKGFDLADYLVKYDYKEFVFPGAEPTEPLSSGQAFVEEKTFGQPVNINSIRKTGHPISGSWNQEIIELENYFERIALPTQTIILNKFLPITNCSKFIQSNISIVKANNGNQTFLPYLKRLQELKHALSTNLNCYEN
ncbi:MAG: hypothetical protein IPM92_11025 [Saprospiraceae bacterium]|nr:hypothetical protein [Saprospiraceae bacterium]